MRVVVCGVRAGRGWAALVAGAQQFAGSAVALPAGSRVRRRPNWRATPRPGESGWPVRLHRRCIVVASEHSVLSFGITPGDLTGVRGLLAKSCGLGPARRLDRP